MMKDMEKTIREFEEFTKQVKDIPEEEFFKLLLEFIEQHPEIEEAYTEQRKWQPPWVSGF